MSEDHGHNPLEHVIDHNTLEIPLLEVAIDLPSILGVQVTRYMVMEFLVAVLMVAIFIPLAQYIVSRRVTKGRFFNLFEAILVFIRDGIARPAIDGNHDAHGHGDEHDDHQGSSHGQVAALMRPSDRYLPYLWTTFFFVLFSNLIGMIPGGASPTSSIAVTGTLAILVFLVVILSGMKASGVAGYWTSLVPKMEVPAVIKPGLWILMFLIEILGLFIKHLVLAVRLFANMLAGHIVLAVILGFIAMAPGLASFVVTPASLLGALAISLLELFVAFLQAYIFTFLAALFIGTAIHPH